MTQKEIKETYDLAHAQFARATAMDDVSLAGLEADLRTALIDPDGIKSDHRDAAVQLLANVHGLRNARRDKSEMYAEKSPAQIQGEAVTHLRALANEAKAGGDTEQAANLDDAITSDRNKRMLDAAKDGAFVPFPSRPAVPEPKHRETREEYFQRRHDHGVEMEKWQEKHARAFPNSR